MKNHNRLNDKKTQTENNNANSSFLLVAERLVYVKSDFFTDAHNTRNCSPVGHSREPVIEDISHFI